MLVTDRRPATGLVEVTPAPPPPAPVLVVPEPVPVPVPEPGPLAAEVAGGDNVESVENSLALAVSGADAIGLLMRGTLGPMGGVLAVRAVPAVAARCIADDGLTLRIGGATSTLR